MFTFDNQPILLQGVLRSAWNLYKASFFHIMVWSLLISILYVLPAMLGYIGIYHIDQWKQIHFSWPGLIIFFTFLFLSTFFVIILLHTMYLLATEQKTDLMKTVQVSVRKVFPAYVAMLIYYIIILIGVMLFLFPGIFVWVLLVMFLPLMIFDDMPVLQSLTYSAKIVWGNWWQTFIAILIPAVLSYAFRNLIRLFTWGDYSIFILDVFIMTLILPYFYTVVLVQYHNLKIKFSLPKPIGQEQRPQS